VSDASLHLVAPDASRARRMLRWGGPTRWLALGTIVVLAVLVLPPLAMLLQVSLTETNPDGSAGALTLRHYAQLFADPHLYASTANSLIFAGGATVVSLLFGGVLAWIVERTNAPLKALAYLTTIVSLGTPYILYVTAWLFLLGRAGPFNDAWRNLGGTGVLFDVYSLWGMVLIEGFLWSPLVFLLLSASFRAANAEMEEAARMSGASILDTVWRISLRLAWPAILAMALFVFIRNLEAFDVPVLVGTPGRVTLLTTDIYVATQQVPPLLGHASAFSMVMVVVVGVLLMLYGRVSRSAERYASVTGKGFRPRPFNLGRARWAAGALVLLNFVLVLGLPLAALLWVSFSPFLRPMRWAGLQTLTLKNYVAVFNVPDYLWLALHTLLVTAGAATAAIVITTVAAWIAARRRDGAMAVDQLATLPLVFPGIVLGVAMMEIALRAPFPLYGTLMLLALGFTIRYMPYGMRYAYSGVLQVHRELEEAAGVAGAGPLGVLRRIVVPLLSPALLSGWLFIFLIGAKELSMAVLLAGPGSQTMAVAMYDLWVNGQGGELSALGLLWALLMTVFASAFYILARRGSAAAYGR
jgi:iron(III) transport system permease protein